jgi:hypothetical protein
MKKKLTLLLGGTLLIGAFAFSGITTSSPTSLKELRSSAAVNCANAWNVDCYDWLSDITFFNMEEV